MYCQWKTRGFGDALATEQRKTWVETDGKLNLSESLLEMGAEVYDIWLICADNEDERRFFAVLFDICKLCNRTVEGLG